MVSCHPDRFSSYYPTAAEPEFVPTEPSITPDDQILVDELRRRGHQVAARAFPNGSNMTMSSSRNSYRRFIILAVLFLAIWSMIRPQPACADEVTRVFLFAGQSNMDDLQPVADVVPVAQSLRSHVARTDDRQPPPGIFGVSAANQFLFSRSSKKTTVTHAKSNAETPGNWSILVG